MRLLRKRMTVATLIAALLVVGGLTQTASADRGRGDGRDRGRTSYVRGGHDGGRSYHHDGWRHRGRGSVVYARPWHHRYYVTTYGGYYSEPYYGDVVYVHRPVVVRPSGFAFNFWLH